MYSESSASAKSRIAERMVLTLIAAVAIALAAVSWVSSQGAQVLTLTNYLPLPGNRFDRVESGPILDYEDPSRYVMDIANDVGNGVATSNFKYLTIAGNLYVYDRIQGTVNLGVGVGYIDLNQTSTYAMYVRSLYTQDTITMGGAAPAEPNAGHHVWDLAEGMPAAAAAAGPAEVVRIDPEAKVPGTLMRTTVAYDPLVAGVISRDPGFLMGDSPGTQPLALAGVVACKVSAQNGPIQRGDLLVSASVPGHAMRAGSTQVQPGMIVGTALEPLAEGTGVINILVNQ